MATLDPRKAMNFDAGSGLAEQWERAFRTYYDAAELSKKKGSTQVAILLHCAAKGHVIDSTSLSSPMLSPTKKTWRQSWINLKHYVSLDET